MKSWVFIFLVLCFASLALFAFPGCGGVPFPACSVPGGARCDGTLAQSCAGGHWYPLTDCGDVGQVCEVREGAAVCK